MLSRKDKNNKILLELEQFLKSYEIYYGERAAICLINAIIKEEEPDFLPEQLKQMRPKKLKRILLQKIKEDLNVDKSSPEYDLKPINKYMHVKASKRRVACASLISAVALASIISIGAISNARKTKEAQQIGSIKNLEVCDDTTIQNTTTYTLNKDAKDGAMKSDVIANTSQVKNKKTHWKKSLEKIAGIAVEMHKKNEENSINNKGNLEKTDDKVVKAISDSKESVEKEVSLDTTKDILKLFNRELDEKKLTEKDLKIMSQVDEDLMIIQSEGENYNQITKDYIVTTEEDGTIKIVHSMTNIEKDFLTNQKINSIPNLVDFTTVSDFIENNNIEKSGYKLSKNTFWGYKDMQEMDEIYGTEVVSCIQKYGLPIPVYQAKDFKQNASKNTSYQKMCSCQ